MGRLEEANLQLQIIGTNTDAAGELHEYVSGQLRKIDSLYGLISTSVKLTEKASKDAAHSFRVEVTVHEPGHVFHSEHNGNSFETAFDQALGKMEQQLKKFKDKRQDSNRHHPGIADIVNAQVYEASGNGAEPRSGFVLEKFNIKPMSEKEAAMQLGMAKRDFFIFLNGQNQVNCVYKRPDGNLGLLLPETEVE
jgi:putative sigma-54 modulation protein